jgi:hypothetical protein
MRSCAIFGHRESEYEGCAEEVKRALVELIEKYKVTQFYLGGRGRFDYLCAGVIKALKEDYPYIKNTLVLSYIPTKKEEFSLPDSYDDSIYLLEKRVPPRLAILKTNELTVLRSDYILSGVKHGWGGANTAVEYAKRKGKRVFEIFRKE